MTDEISVERAHQVFHSLCKLLTVHKDSNHGAKLVLLKSSVTWVGRFLYTYQPDSSSTTEYNDDILPAYHAIADEASVADLYRQLQAFVCRLRDELAGPTEPI